MEGPGERCDVGRTGPSGQRDDHGEGTQVHGRVDDQIGDGGRQGLVAVGQPVAGHGQRGDHEARLGDARVGHEAHHVGLAQGDQVADRHGQGGQDPDQRLPHFAAGVEADEDQGQQGNEACRLGGHRQEGGDRGGRPFVDVGCPGVKRDGRHLEGEAGHHEHDAHGHYGRRSPCGGHAGTYLGQQGGARHAIEERHAVEHHRRGEHTHQVVLQAGFGGVEVPLAPRHQQVRRDGQQLQGHEDGDQIAGRSHHHHAHD